MYRPRSGGSPHTAPNKFNLSPSALPMMYVYCDVLQHVVVGDVMAPRLRIVDVKTTTTTMKHQILNPPLYVSLLKKNFDTIEINIMTDEGTPSSFVDGNWSSCCSFIFHFIVINKTSYIHVHKNTGSITRL